MIRTARVAALLGALLLVVGVAGCASEDDAGPGDAGASPAVVDLVAGPGPAGVRCIPVTSESVARMPLALRGTAVTVADDEVVLDVEEWYVGGDAGQVRLEPGGPVGPTLFGDVAYAEGESYLITASEGRVSVCGFSGPATPELQAIYDAAFAE